MELECDLSTINNEELLRKMWQQSEDVNRKKEIRSQLYKLRESRLRDLYQGDIMADHSAAGFGKDPLVTSHGDALADQSFQSLKSKEIRDSLSPTEMRFQSMTLNNPNTTGWNVQSSKEVSPDGRGFRAETVATTDGVENVNGGTAEFKGRNEQRSSAHHEGDDKNFLKKAMESSNSHLQEKVVIGDENSGRTEVRTSSTKSTSSSQVIQSSTNVEYENGIPIQQQPHPQKYLMDNNRIKQQDFEQLQQQEQQRLLEEQRIYEQKFQQQRQHQLNQQELHTTEQRQNTQKKNISQNIQTQETHEKNKRYVDMDKASPEYQQHVQHLMQQPGEVISSTVEYPKPNVKMITTVKRLPDGTIVRNKRYETEELTPTTPTTRTTSTNPNQVPTRRDSPQPPTGKYQPDSSPQPRSSEDMVDSANTRHIHGSHTDDVETKFSSIKKSSSKFSTQTTSETIKEFDEHHPQDGPRPRPKTNDFSTHGFPSVRADKPTQEYPSERPHTAHPTHSPASHPGAARPKEDVVPRYTDDTDNISERRVNTKDGEVIIVSSEKKRNVKTSSNSERIVETEHIVHDDQPYQQSPHKSPQDFSTHGFPSIREPTRQQPNYPSEREMQPHQQDFHLANLPPGHRITSKNDSPQGDEEVVVVSSQKFHTAKQSTNIERTIEHDIIRGNQDGSYPHIQPNKDSATPYNYTVTTPGEQIPRGEYPGSFQKPNSADYSTQGFPSVKIPVYVTPGKEEPHNGYPAGTPKQPSNDYTQQSYPSAKAPSRPAAGLPSSYNQHPGSPRKSPTQDYSTQGFPSVRSPSKTTPTHGYPSNVDGPRPTGTPEQLRSTPTAKPQSRTQSPNKYKTPNTTVRETTERVIRKEKEVDSAHRAFAASLRSSSPLDHTDYHPRHTPRSSVSSTRTFRRDMREGSHDSAPSEASRITTTTITRNTPPRVVGGRTVVTKSVTTKTVPGSNDSLNVISPRATKSPSPGKTVTTTTTTTRTQTSKDVPKVTDKQHTRITSNKIDTIFPINEPPLTSITKIKFSDNHKQPHKQTKYNYNNNNNKQNIAAKADSIANASAGVREVIEAPCLKKNYYKLGPSDEPNAQLNTTTFHSLKSPQISEKSPTKKPSSQPQQAPSSRSSTPSFSSKKPATFVMKDDHDDDDMLNKTSPFSSPSSRSRAPQKIVPKVNDKPQDDWQLPRQPDSDEGRTVNKETMFENPEEKPLQPHKPKFEQPNVEWIIVDDQDNYDTDGDNDSFAPEVVDAQLNVRKTTTKLIAQEKQIPVAPRKKAPSMATTTTTVTTKQFHTTPSKSHIKPNDKSPLKTKPLVSKTPQQIRTSKPLTDSKPVVQTPSKTPSKTLNNKSVTKRPVSAVPSYVSPQRKPQPNTSADKSPLKKTLTTSKLSMEKTTKLIETERLKDRGTKTETTHKILTIKPKGLESHPPHYADDEHFEGFPQKLQEQPEPFNPDFCNTQDIFYTPQPDSPEFNRPQNTQNEATNLTPGTQELKVVDKPRHKSPASRKPQSPGFQKLQRTFDEHSPRFGKPYISDDDEPIENYPPEGLEPQNFIEDHIIISETTKNFYPDQQVTQRPQQPTPGTNKPLVSKLEPSLVLPEDSFEPHQDAPYYLKPQSKDFESNKGLPSYKSPQEIYEANVVVSETYQRKVPESEMPKKSLKTPENTTNRKPYGSEDKPIEGPTRTPYSKRKPIQNYKQPGTVRPEFEPLDTDDDEYPTENENSLVTSKKTVAKHIQKFETNFMKTHKPKPQKETKTPTKASPQALQKLPKTPVKPQQHKETTKIEAYDTEEEEQFENTTEFVINSKQKYVTSEKQSQFNEAINPNMNVSSRNNEKSPERQLPEESKTTGSRSPQRFISPTRNQNKPKESTRKAPEEPKKSGSKSPQRIISPTRTEMKPKEPFTRRPHSPNEHFSPNRNQTQPRESGRMVPEEPQNKGGSKSPQRFISPTRAQKKPEKPVDERSKSPNKYVSPQRPQKTNDSETFTTAMKATKVVKENTTKEFHSEQYPEGQEPSFREPNVDETYPVVQKPSRKPNVNETFIEFESNSTQKRNIIEDQITQFEEPQQPNRKPAKLKPTRESSPTKIQELPEKRAQSPNKYVSPTRTERKPSQTLPVDQQTFKNTLRTSDSVAEKIIRKSGEKDHPKDNIPLKQADKPETKPMRPKFYPKQTSDTEDDEPSTQEIVIRQEVPQPHSTRPRTDSKSNPKSVSPTFGHSKPFEKPSVVKLTEPVKTRSQSPNKSVSPSRTEKKPNEEVPPKDNKTFLTSFTTTNIVRKQTTHDDDNAKYQQIKNTHTEEPLGKKPESINKPLAPIINEKSVVKNNATIETSSIVTEKTDKDLPHQQYPEKTIPYKKPSSPSYKTKQPNKPDFEDEDEAFLETNERVIISKTCKITEDLVKEPETPLRDISPKHTQNEAPHKPPQEPAKKSQLPQRDHEEPTNEDEILQISFKTKKTVEEKTTRDLGRYEKHPEKPEPQEKNYKPETRPEDEILTQATGHLITSKTHLGNEKVVQEFRESNKPQTDILPSIASGPKAPKATKISRSPTRPQKKPDQTILSDEETLTKIDKTTKFPAEKINTEKPKAYESSPFKTTETDGDETILETTELVFETTDKPRYPDIQQTDKKPQYITSEFDLTNDKQSFVHTSEFVRNTSQKLIKTQQKILEIENEPYYTDNEELPRSKDLYSPDSKGEKSPKTPSKRQQSPVRSPSSKTERPKSIPADDKTFKKSLRTTHTVTNPKHDKPHHSKSTGTDENETDTDTEAEDLLIETCENIYVVEKNVIAEKEQEKFLPTLHTPGNKSPKGPRTLVESIETVEKQNYPKEEELFSVTKKPSKHKQPFELSQEAWLPKQVTQTTTNVNEQFIEGERLHKETPDGAFISKTTEPSTPTSPTFRKKGAGRSDTFEERCRQILGMDNYGDTSGSYKQQPFADIEEKETIATKNATTVSEEDLRNAAIFQVKVEDCDEDDEPFSIDSVKQNVHKIVHTTEKRKNEPKTNERTEPKKKTENFPNKPEPKDPKNEHKSKKDENNEFEQTIIKTTTVHKKTPNEDEIKDKASKNPIHSHPKAPTNIFEPQDYSESEFEQTITETKRTPKNEQDDKVEPDFSGPEIEEEKFVKKTKKSEIKITKKPSPTSTPRSNSPSKNTSAPRSLSPTKGSPAKDLEPKLNKKSPQNRDESTSTIKDRLRSSTRKTKSPAKHDQVEGSESSPEHSPTRFNERRRSSNISVTTEIIIDHADSDTPHKKEKSPTIARKPHDSVYKEIIDSTVLPEKLTRRLPVTERKESAPVHRVTSKDKDTKMSRSTSENLIKVKNTETPSSTSKTPTKSQDHRRPNKCFATKSINLSATDRLVNSKEMENVIIDIQHAKSSREPSPDKIVPTPVPANLDTGKPRYPDMVQEPEDDRPKRNYQVKNIPIFEEENNSYVGCHITEINMEKSRHTTYDSLDYEEQILKNPVVEAPPSLDYISVDKPVDDESLLTVHEKVNKFQTISENVSKPKTINTTDSEDNIYSSIKLAPSAPQKSPELVRTISRHISKQTDLDYNDEPNEDYPQISHNDDYVECLVNNKKTTKEFKVSHHEKTNAETAKTAEKCQQPGEYVDDHDDHDDDELVPHTATHTTIIEERRQKDILNRPSVFDSRNKKPTATATTTTKTLLKCNKSPVKDSEKIRPDIKSRTIPTSAVTNTATEQAKATTTTTTTTINATTNKPKQSPQRKDSDIDYELRGSNVETGVRNIISKQTKVYNNNKHNNNNNDTSSDSKTNDLKKLTTTTSNKKPEKHMPVRLTPSKNPDEHDLSADDNEMIVYSTETTDIDIGSQVVNEDLNTEISNRQIPLNTTTIHKKVTTTAHSSTHSSPTKEHLVKLTDKHPLKSNQITTNTSIKTYETIEKADDIDETVLEPSTKKSPTQTHQKTPKMSTTVADSVAAKRSLFESNNGSQSTTHIKRTPVASPMSGRRPSYMDHTKSSLEHTRKDSLEINKTNYSRKPSQPEEELTAIDRNSTVKFDVPHGKRATTPRTASVTEDINVEEIFELEILEKLLEIVQSYEIRRRIRAQIRLIKKNQKNELMSNSVTDLTTKTVKTSKMDGEETDTATSTDKKRKPEEKTPVQTTQAKDMAASHISSTKKEYIFEETYHPTTRRSPKPNRYPYEEEMETSRKPTRSQSPQPAVCRRNAEHERHHSPEKHKQTEVVKHHSSRITKQEYHYKDEHDQEEVLEVRHETSPTRRSPSPGRKPHSSNSSPERRYASPELRNNDRNRSPQMKSPQSSRPTGSRSPNNKIGKAAAGYEKQESVKTSSIKPQTKRTTTTSTKSKPEDKTPVWADRKNILKTPTSNTPKKPSSTTLDSRAGYTKTIKSTTSQKMTSNKSSFVDDDCVTSSYGIGPTDENGLPLFGIRALKKKKPSVEPSETTEVTGYVVEEKYYSDNKTKPTLERKEFIYSTNPEELQKLQKQVEVTTNKKSVKDVEIKESKQAALISKATTPALRSSPEDDFLDSTTKYGRRGSVKEMSEKFIQKEAASSVTEKSNNYPKAGLILRTNSRKSSRDIDNENENFETFKTTRSQQHHTSSVLADSDDNQFEYEVEEVASRHSGRFITESESECDSIKTQREFKHVTSSSSMATRSFLNSQGEEKVVTNVSDCLERMRNADNVVEEGDTAEDQEARALLNKFLGASIIMKGVESSLPATNRQSKIITTTTTSSNLSDDNDGDNNAKHEVKTTRITKTIKSGSSSTPVTYTTCDIEEIWDEEILKELLEQARTYEERRKIRSRLRELMADREETKKSPKGDEKETTTAILAAVSDTREEEESSASEYEEIIEEVTDYSEAESEVDDGDKDKKIVISAESPNKEKHSDAAVTKATEKSVTVTIKAAKPSAQQENHTEQVEEIKTVIETETVEEEFVEENGDKADSSEKGESLKSSMVHDKPQKTLQAMPQENSVHSQPSTNSQKLKSSQTNIDNKNKTTLSESSSMYASHNNSNLKNQKATSTAPTAGRADSTSISNKNNSSTNAHNNNASSSGSLGGNFVVVGSSGSPRQVDRLGVPHKEDSGTESGEDLRLIAAGLRDQLQVQSDSNIIEDVTCALSRLENSLKEGKDISIDTEKRKALLALVARLRAGLTSPEKLAEIAAAMSELDGNECLYGESSSPEADAHRPNRSRFGKRKNRVIRHTVGVSQEELADARRYMEDMLLMSNISQSNTPDANTMPNNTPPQWYPLEKNASTGAILTPSFTPVLQRPKQFVSEEKSSIQNTNRLTVNNGKRRPLSGEFSVSFENSEPDEPKVPAHGAKQGSPEEASKSSRFINKKHLMKRANTIDLAKSHKYNPEFDTDSDAEDKTANLGLKRAVQVSVKKRVQNVVPPFEPKTENDRKFLAFINKQSDKPGLGWTNSRSVSNWTNKFGSIKSTFEGGLVGKPPQFPHHITATSKTQQTGKLFTQSIANNSADHQTINYISNQQIALRLQREAERQAEERRRKLEKERLEYERRERDKLERQRQQRERQERERLEREHFERQRREQDQITATQHAAILREQQQLAVAQQAAAKMNVPQPIPINEFKHAPQSVFRPIESDVAPSKPIYKPIPQLARNANNWPADLSRSQANTSSSPGQYGNTRPDNSFITSPPPSTRSPIALPWASKPTVDSSSFRSKAHRFEERSKYDNITSTPYFVQRHNSLRSANGASNHISDDFRKRPSLPNTFEPYSVRQQNPTPQDPLAHLPPPQNISFTYSSLKPKVIHQSYPCLPLAVFSNPTEYEHRRSREDSLTDPHAVPLVLTSTNPSYCPAPQSIPKFQHQQPSQKPLPRQFDLVSPGDSAPTSPNIYTMTRAECTDDDFDSDSNLLEYHAVSRVMGKPQSQTAVTIGRRTGHLSDDELYGKNSRAAKNLLSTMKNLGNPNGLMKPKAEQTKRAEVVTSPKTCFSPDGRSYQAPVVEPLFPEINKFEANRKPLYANESITKSTGSTYEQPSQRSQMGLHKSLENINRITSKTQSNVTQKLVPKPYVSETQTSYVVTYPLEDMTDDEDFNRLNQKNMMPPNSLDLSRHRKTSENSTASSTTTSFCHNLPSPNTSWTSNPIVQNESSKYPNITSSYQNNKISSSSSNTEPTYQAHKSQLTSGYSGLTKNYETEYETSNLGQRSTTSAHEQTLVGSTNKGSASKSSKESNFQRQLQNPNQVNPKHISQQIPEKPQIPAVTQKQSSHKTVSTTSTIKEHKSTTSIRGGDQPAINPKNSNISEEMIMRLDQQRERISNEIRRKSMGNTQDYQIEKQTRCETTTQSSQVYKSSAPPDTPDIVKSSLPKDETVPILKKFGPPQRHHYMPNSYQSPSANTTSSSVAAMSTHSTKAQGKSLHSSSKQSVVKISQQILSITKPTVMETPATPQPDDDYIPRNIVYNNVHAFSSMTRRQEDENTNVNQHPAVRPSKLSKSDSWNQILMLQNQHAPTNKIQYNQSPTNELRRTKSGHTLAVPKMFEAAMTKTDITEKQKTVAAYFSGQKSPTQPDAVVEQLQQTTKRSVISRTKTSEKVSAASRKSLGVNLPIVPGGLQRSATMPHIANVNLLDESNVEDAFEQLIMEQKQQKSTSSTTEKTETKEEDGAVVTTTTKVTTRTVAGSAAKPVTPFAKFKQLDKQNSQQSAKSPTTPTTTGGGSTASPTSGNQPIFKFTDPALNAKAATVKEQLLQWCQSKTQEYENIEITNFSTSWNNGLAFCALIHHFLPDAFDYNELTPKNRRKNFELAFTVADEKAGIAPLLDVEDMVVMQRPDWKCVFVYVQSIYRRFRNCQ